jgi:hypothetical protein
MTWFGLRRLLTKPRCTLLSGLLVDAIVQCNEMCMSDTDSLQVAVNIHTVSEPNNEQMSQTSI